MSDTLRENLSQCMSPVGMALPRYVQRNEEPRSGNTVLEVTTQSVHINDGRTLLNLKLKNCGKAKNEDFLEMPENKWTGSPTSSQRDIFGMFDDRASGYPGLPRYTVSEAPDVCRTASYCTQGF